MHKYSWLCFFLLVVVACNQDSEVAMDPRFENTNIDPEFIPFVESFLIEAEIRRDTIDLSTIGLEIQFGDATNSTDVLGSCDRDHHIVTISEVDWNNLSNNHREALIFHELGHCILDRDHETDRLSNGEVASIMWPSIQGKLFGARRKYYVDELFEHTFPVSQEPDWVSNSAIYNVPFARDSIKQIDIVNVLNEQILIDSLRNFEIEFEIETLTDERSGLAWGSEDLNTALFVTVQKPMQVDIETGRQLYGRIYHEPFSEIADKNFNKISIRRIDSDYFFFVNEQFIFWMEFFPFVDNTFQTFSASREGIVDFGANVKISNLKINYLN